MNENTNLDEELITEIVNAITILQEETIDQVLKLGRLVSFNWSIRNNINNKDIDKVNRLFVELEFSIKKPDLTITNHTFSLSLPEFRVKNSFNIKS